MLEEPKVFEADLSLWRMCTYTSQLLLNETYQTCMAAAYCNIDALHSFGCENWAIGSKCLTW